METSSFPSRSILGTRYIFTNTFSVNFPRSYIITLRGKIKYKITELGRKEAKVNPDVSEKSGIWGERNGTQDVRRNCKEAEKRFFL